MTQTLEAQKAKEGRAIDITPDADWDGGDIIQTPDGRAGVFCGDATSGDVEAAEVAGVFTILKAASVYIMAGAPVYWDHSARRATPVPPLVSGDRDFYLGVAVEDSEASDTTVKVAININPRYEIDLFRSGFDTAIVAAAGSPTIFNRGGSVVASLSSTAEAQKLDLLSKRSFPLGSNWIIEGVFEVVTNAGADVCDVSLGAANGTHASDADSITESAFIHLDLGGSLNILAESDDGTTEVAATDTTKDFAVGTAFHFAIDGRDPSALKIYINGERVLSGTTFNISAATGPLFLLFHIEKSANAATAVVQVDQLTMRYAQ